LLVKQDTVVWLFHWPIDHVFVRFVGAVTNLRKAATSFVMYVCLNVCPSFRLQQLNSHWTKFHRIWYLSTFRKSVEKIQVSLKSDKNNG